MNFTISKSCSSMFGPFSPEFPLYRCTRVRRKQGSVFIQLAPLIIGYRFGGENELSSDVAVETPRRALDAWIKWCPVR